MDKNDFEKYILKIIGCVNLVSVNINDESLDSSQKLIGNLSEVIGEIYMNGFKAGFKAGLDADIKKQKIGI